MRSGRTWSSSTRPARKSCRSPTTRTRSHRHGRRPATRSRSSTSRARSTSSIAYLDRLAARSAALGTVLCLGLDPDPAALPAGFSADLRGVEAFARLLLAAAGPHAAAVKPNLAFFEAFGSAGIAALERL